MTSASVRLHHVHRAPRESRGLRARLLQWLARRQMATLLSMDDHLLTDMGITRDDVHHARQLPLSLDAGDALTRIALGRRGNM